MITFILGFALGIIVGVVGIICIGTTQTNRKEKRYADKE